MQNCANHRRLIQGIYIILMDDKKIELLDAKKQRTPDTCKSCSVDAGRRKKGVVGASAIIKTDARHLKKILWTLDTYKYTPRTPDTKPIPPIKRTTQYFETKADKNCSYFLNSMHLTKKIVSKMFIINKYMLHQIGRHLESSKHIINF